MTSVWQKRRSRVQIRRTRARRGLTRYFRSIWRPAAFCVVMLLLLTLVGAMNETALLSSTYLSTVLGSLCGVGIAIAFIGLVTATVWNLVNKYWIKSTLSLCLLVGVCYALNMTIANLFLFSADDAVLESSMTTFPSAEISEATPIAESQFINATLSKTSELSPNKETVSRKAAEQQSLDSKQESIQTMPAGLSGY